MMTWGIEFMQAETAYRRHMLADLWRPRHRTTVGARSQRPRWAIRKAWRLVARASDTAA